jgi:PEP-CTERM motif
MNRVFILAVVLALTVMCASGAVVTLGTFAVNPQGTFLDESSNDSNVSALFISLTCPVGVTTNCVNATPGSVLQLIGIGSMCYGAGYCGAAELGGVFDSNNVSINPQGLTGGNVDRLTGIIGAGVSNLGLNHNPFLNTFFGNVDTTIPNDFIIPTGTGLTVVVPNGASFLVVGVLDSYFADNTANGSNPLAIQINQITPPSDPPGVPEPATFGLLAIGFAGMLAYRRRLSH